MAEGVRYLSNLEQRIAARVQQVVEKNTQQDSCWSPGNNDNKLEYITIKVLATPGLVAGAPNADIVVNFKSPHRFFGVASIKNQFNTSNIFLHLDPLGKQPEYDASGSTAIAPDGNENWIPLVEGTTFATGHWIRFAKAVQQFYVDIDHPAGGFTNFFYVTFVGSDDIEFFYAHP